MCDRCIVCFGDDWGRTPQTLEYLVRDLLQRNDVIWVNSLGHRRPTFSRKDFRRIIQKLRLAAKQPTLDLPPRLTVIRPLGIPFHEYRFVRKMNALILGRMVKKHLKRLGADRPILITNSPINGELVGRLNERLVAYYCLDDYTAFERMLRNMKELEEEMLGKSDVAFFVSQRLFDLKQNKPQRSYVISQGVETDHFTRREPNARTELDHLPRPIIGYMGWLEKWVDVDLLAYIARKRPDWSVVAMGRSAISLDAYRGIPNLHLLKYVPYPELPGYARGFDVGLIPFKVNELTLACNPLKLLEYFSMGTPVVSTPLPEVEKYAPLVSIATGYDEFIAAIEQALRNDSPAIRTERRQKAEAASWPALLNAQAEAMLEAERARWNSGRPQDMPSMVETPTQKQ
jgi:glycosyltransferase involved in cell wall biosynthesis